ncbi:MAG: ABC transporter substrate-binding protein, partial [Acetobacteraceae bacterium]|nr:ABC transporter substrate-binding protein [Acetobacteraceae bacterium]
MRRREFITLLGGAGAWPLAVRAQQPAMPVVGFLSSVFPEPSADFVSAFRRGLAETGYVEGQNLALEYRWAQGQLDRLPALAAELVQQQVSVLATAGGPPTARAAQAATSTIPVVFVTGDDPVTTGLVASLNRPGANVTGISFLTSELAAKRLQLLGDLLPKANVIGLLTNPASPQTESEIRLVQAAAHTLGQRIVVVNAANERDFDAAFAALVDARVDALVVLVDAIFTNGRAQLATLAAKDALPAIYGLREYADAGGLMSYGSSIVDAYRQA